MPGQKVQFPGGDRGRLVQFIREERMAMSYIRWVVVDPQKSRIIDVNRKELVFPGVTYGHEMLETILREAGASFDPQTYHVPPPTAGQVREFGCSATYPWAHDRIA